MITEGILLAAGESRRMGYPKPLLRLGDRTFVEAIVIAMLEVLPRVVVVIGAHADRVRAAIPSDPRISVVFNPNFERGQLSSIKAGLGALQDPDAAALIHLSDHPMVLPATFRALLDEHARSGKPIVVARYHGRRGHPVFFARPLFKELLAAPEDRGAKAVVDADPERVAYASVDDPGVVLDLDTPEDLERAGLGRPSGPLAAGNAVRHNNR